MKNRTSPTNNSFSLTQKPDEADNYHNWLVFCQTVTSLLCIGLLWLSFCLIRYSLSRKKLKFTKNTVFKPKYTMILLAITSPIAAFLRTASTQMIIVVGKFPDFFGSSACEITMDISLVLYCFTLLPVYFFIWFRQKIIYSQPVMKQFNTGAVKLLSKFFVLSFLFGGIFSLYVAVEPKSYANSPHNGSTGCVLENNNETNITSVRHFSNYMAAAIVVVSQFLLLGLLLNPLLKQSKFSCRDKKSKCQRKLFRVIRKASACTLVCILTQILATVLTTSKLIPASFPRVLSYVIYDVSLFVQVNCIVLCFEDSCAILRNKKLKATSKLSEISTVSTRL